MFYVTFNGSELDPTENTISYSKWNNMLCLTDIHDLKKINEKFEIDQSCWAELA